MIQHVNVSQCLKLLLIIWFSDILNKLNFRNRKRRASPNLQACAAAPERVTPRFQARVEGGDSQGGHQI